MKLIFLTYSIILFLMFGCAQTRFAKKDINLYFLFYDFECEKIQSNSIKCNVRFDIDEDYSMNEPKIILFLYDLLYHVSKHGVESGYKYGKLTDWKMGLAQLKVNGKNNFAFEFSKSVEQDKLVGYSYQLEIGKYFPLDDAIKMKEYWDNVYQKDKNGKPRFSVRDTFVHEPTGLSFLYRYRIFKRKDIWEDYLAINYSTDNPANMCFRKFKDTDKVVRSQTDVRIHISEVKESKNSVPESKDKITQPKEADEFIYHEWNTLQINGSTVPLESYAKLDKKSNHILEAKKFIFKNFSFDIHLWHYDGIQKCNSEHFEELFREMFH